MPPSQIVPSLADKGIYLASESTFYRVLREHNMQHHRGHASDRNPRPLSTHCATEPNQVWTWDITYLSGPIKGTYFYLYMISDLFDRSIVGWEVWPEQSAKNSSDLIKRTIIAQGIKPPLKAPLVLHSDNGSPMKGATMLETLYKLGLTPSNSRQESATTIHMSKAFLRQSNTTAHIRQMASSQSGMRVTGVAVL